MKCMITKLRHNSSTAGYIIADKGYDSELLNDEIRGKLTRPLAMIQWISITIGTSDVFMRSYLAPKTFSFYVENLRNSLLLRAILASNLKVLDHNLFRPE